MCIRDSLCFGYDGEIYVKDTQGKPAKVKIDIVGDDAKNNIANLRFACLLYTSPSVADKANEYISKYSVYFPSKDDAFFRSITAGKSVQVGGWINETTTARFKE